MRLSDEGKSRPIDDKTRSRVSYLVLWFTIIVGSVKHIDKKVCKGTFRTWYCDYISTKLAPFVNWTIDIHELDPLDDHSLGSLGAQVS